MRHRDAMMEKGDANVGAKIGRRWARSVFCQRKRLDMQKYLLGLDNGGTYIKAAIYDLCGREWRQLVV